MVVVGLQQLVGKTQGQVARQIVRLRSIDIGHLRTEVGQGQPPGQPRRHEVEHAEIDGETGRGTLTFFQTGTEIGKLRIKQFGRDTHLELRRQRRAVGTRECYIEGIERTQGVSLFTGAKEGTVGDKSDITSESTPFL